MRCNAIVVLGSLFVTSPVLAQDNPFAFTGGSVKSAYIVYEVTSKKQQGAGSSYEVGVAPDRWIMRMTSPFEIAGKKDTVRILSVTTRDSQYTYTAMGSAKGDGEVGPTLRSHLAREYAALNASARARFKQNLKLAAKASGSISDADDFITLTGEKTGSESVAGQKCDVYRSEAVTACVIPNAPMVMLRWSNSNDGVEMVARKVTLNGPIPQASGVLPKGVAWKKKEYDDADFVTEIWALKKQSDPASVPPATLTKFAVGYLASPGATAELQEMAGPGADEQTPDSEDGDDSEER